MLSLLAAALLAGFVFPGVAGASATGEPGEPERLVTGLKGGSGSAMGPDGALYVTEAEAGRLTRIDPETGDTTVVASCLPERVAPFPGGAVDVTFKGGTPYVLVTLVSSHAPVNGTSVAGIYRIDGPDECTVIADLGTWSADNPPEGDFEAPVVPGVQFALDSYRGGFLVTDGHHNRVLFVERDGDVHELIQLPNIVPTGLDVEGSKIFLALAGPTPHRPEDGRIVSLRGWSPEPREVAGGAPLLVDVERCGHQLFGLAQGDFPEGADAGAPALPETGELRVADDGELRLLVEGLDRPSSLTFIGDTAYVVTLGGEVWTVPDVCDRHDD
jgi:sugar lactone lactonase YvrE